MIGSLPCSPNALEVGAHAHAYYLCLWWWCACVRAYMLCSCLVCFTPPAFALAWGHSVCASRLRTQRSGRAKEGNRVLWETCLFVTVVVACLRVRIRAVLAPRVAAAQAFASAGRSLSALRASVRSCLVAQKGTAWIL